MTIQTKHELRPLSQNNQFININIKKFYEQFQIIFSSKQILTITMVIIITGQISEVHGQCGEPHKLIITEKKVNPTYFWSKFDDFLIKKSIFDENLIKFRPDTKAYERFLIKKPHFRPNFDLKSLNFDQKIRRINIFFCFITVQTHIFCPINTQYRNCANKFHHETRRVSNVLGRLTISMSSWRDSSSFNWSTRPIRRKKPRIWMRSESYI